MVVQKKYAKASESEGFGYGVEEEEEKKNRRKEGANWIGESDEGTCPCKRDLLYSHVYGSMACLTSHDVGSVWHVRCADILEMICS